MRIGDKIKCPKCLKMVTVQPSTAEDYVLVKCPWSETYETKTGKVRTRRCGFKEWIRIKL